MLVGCSAGLSALPLSCGAVRPPLRGRVGCEQLSVADHMPASLRTSSCSERCRSPDTMCHGAWSFLDTALRHAVLRCDVPCCAALCHAGGDRGRVQGPARPHPQLQQHGAGASCRAALCCAMVAAPRCVGICAALGSAGRWLPVDMPTPAGRSSGLAGRRRARPPARPVPALAQPPCWGAASPFGAWLHPPNACSPGPLPWERMRPCCE